MREANVYNFARALPRMSWSPRNLYNLYLRSIGNRKETFKTPRDTLFQQRWKSKSLLRAYHGDFINEKIFKRWYLPSTLPDVRPKAGSKITESIGLAKWARKDNVAEQSEKQLEEERQKSLAPVGSLMFAEVERRIDVVIFRACLASSVYEARRLIVHGDVLLNGKKHQDANTRLAPGDMVSVKPEAVRFIQRPQKKVKAKAAKSEDAEEDAEETEVEQWTEQTRPPTASADPAKPPSSYAKKKAGSDLTYFRLPPFAAPWIFIPAYIETQFTTCSAIYLRHPTARPGYSEIPTPYDADGEHVRFAWEWYVRRRPRIRSKSQLARMPTNRQ